MPYSGIISFYISLTVAFDCDMIYLRFVTCGSPTRQGAKMIKKPRKTLFIYMISERGSHDDGRFKRI